MPQLARSAIFAKIIGNSRNLAGIILHRSVVIGWVNTIFASVSEVPEKEKFATDR